MAKIKIQIKNRWAGRILFEYEKEDNTIKDTVIEAVKNGTDLGGANLNGANLLGTDLSGANLNGANLWHAHLSNADLRDADLRDADLGYADLRGANLNGALLRDANLRDADLIKADLGFADLRGANLINASLNGADLRGTYLRGTRLRDADLSGADLWDADLRGADLSGTKGIPYIPLACPSDGSFVGWKKVGDKLIKLEIPEDAKRCSANSQKCRCDKAKVLAITDLNGENPINEIENVSREPHTLYKVGEIVLPDSFDENRWNECSNGIHFFINKQDAINY